MKKFRSLGVLAALAVGFAACGSSSSGGGGTDTAMAGKATCAAQAGVGVLCGKAVAADGVTPLASAEVQLVSSSAGESAKLATLGLKGVEDPTKCVADAAGDFACVVPSGSTGSLSFLIILSGYANGSFTATITADTTTDAGTQILSGSSSEKWVVVPGTYDGVQVLLAQLKGCTLHDLSGNAFDPATMDAADARASTDCTDKGLLVLDGPDDPDTLSENYVPTFLKSSSLANYAALFINCNADWSTTEGVDAAIQSYSNSGKHIYFSDLSDDWLTSAFPDKITFGGHSTDTGTVSGDVVDTNLAAVVGDPIDIVFDLPVWADIDSVVSGVTTYIQGDISALSTLTGVHPITVGWRGGSSAGCIFYTSYHIEGASTGSKQELAIKYMVQNIPTVCPAL